MWTWRGCDDFSLVVFSAANLNFECIASHSSISCQNGNQPECLGEGHGQLVKTDQGWMKCPPPHPAPLSCPQEVHTAWFIPKGGCFYLHCLPSHIHNIPLPSCQPGSDQLLVRVDLGACLPGWGSPCVRQVLPSFRSICVGSSWWQCPSLWGLTGFLIPESQCFRLVEIILFSVPLTSLHIKNSAASRKPSVNSNSGFPFVLLKWRDVPRRGLEPLCRVLVG